MDFARAQPLAPSPTLGAAPVVAACDAPRAPLSVTMRLMVFSSLMYILVYFLRYPIFMLDLSIQERVAFTAFGATITLQDALVLAFCLGFAIAKIPALKVMTSSLYFEHRLAVIAILNILTALLFTLPLGLTRGDPMWTALGVFLGCFPTSWVYGGVVVYLEGRLSTDLNLAVITGACVFGGGAARSVAQAIIAMGVAPHWMPGMISFAVLPFILLFAWALDRLPPPNAADIAARQVRRSMSIDERQSFNKYLGPGLFLLYLTYAMLTAVRQFRDLFSKDILTAANRGRTPSSSMFFLIDLPGGMCASLTLAMFGCIQDNHRALLAMFGCQLACVSLMLLATYLFDRDIVNGIVWEMALGVGAFGAYFIVSSGSMYDRILACTPSRGATCTFLMFQGDLCGYFGAISLLVWKMFIAGKQESNVLLSRFMLALYALGAGMLVCGFGAFSYFHVRLRERKTCCLH